MFNYANETKYYDHSLMKRIMLISLLQRYFARLDSVPAVCCSNIIHICGMREKWAGHTIIARHLGWSWSTAVSTYSGLRRDRPCSSDRGVWCPRLINSLRQQGVFCLVWTHRGTAMAQITDIFFIMVTGGLYRSTKHHRWCPVQGRGIKGADDNNRNKEMLNHRY